MTFDNVAAQLGVEDPEIAEPITFMGISLPPIDIGAITQQTPALYTLLDQTLYALMR